MALRLLTLDATGTVFKFRYSPVEAYVSVASHYGFKLAEDRVSRQFREVYKRMQNEHPHFGSTTKLDSMQWWIKTAQDTLEGSHNYVITDSNVFKPVAIHLYKLFSTSAAYQVYPDFIEFAQKCRTNHPHLKFCVVSNFDRRLKGILTQLGVAPFIDAIVYSEEACTSKPDPAIFLRAIDKSGLTPSSVRPSEIIHVGDDLNNDYLGAKALGWRSILLNRKNFKDEDLDVPVEDMCKDFSELLLKI